MSLWIYRTTCRQRRLVSRFLTLVLIFHTLHKNCWKHTFRGTFSFLQKKLFCICTCMSYVLSTSGLDLPNHLLGFTEWTSTFWLGFTEFTSWFTEWISTSLPALTCTRSKTIVIYHISEKHTWDTCTDLLSTADTLSNYSLEKNM